MKKKLVVLTGAGVSAESGIPTFRDADGLWMGYDVNVVASIEGWKRYPATVLEFYNMRRRDALKAQPNDAHKILAALEERFAVTIITQNVDDLHERAGSTHVIHLHGELLKMRSERDSGIDPQVQKIFDDIKMGDLAEDEGQLRPHIVWFGELVPMIEVAVKIVSEADIFLVVGTSLQVYPAAGLIHYVPDETPKYIIDLHPPAIPNNQNYHIITNGACAGMQEFKKLIEDGK